MVLFLLQIISYPNFFVKIVRSSGQTLHFTCTCNTHLNEEDLESEPSEDEQFDLFRFENVKIYNDSDGEKNAYAAETETMDGVSLDICLLKCVISTT